ncbi:MAG: TetR/AcrR family transcriptional regulator [Burkholderiales bacterium]|nr:TetR/AcrR family transcriptional regulator [Burkholderiales bacterium]
MAKVDRARAAPKPARHPPGGSADVPVGRGAVVTRRTHAERREEAEQRLLEAALEIVARRGSVRMTLAEVGEAAGYSRGLAAHRFGSKAGLVHALAGHIGRRFGEQRERGPVLQPGLDAILGNIRFYFSRKGGAWTATRALLVMMTEGCMEPNEALRKELAAYNRKAAAWFEQHLRAAITQGEVAADIDPAATAVILLGVMRGVMHQWLVDDRIRIGAVRDQLLRVVQQALRPAPP